LWILYYLLSLVWMVGYPLWLARRRHARLPRLALSTVALEAALALPVFILLSVVLTVVFMAWVYLAGGSLPRNPLEGPAETGNWVVTAVVVLAAVTVAPLTEEVFFRGMLYNGLRQRIHPLPAAILQAAVFGLLHSFGYVHAVGAALIGLALAGLYEWRRTLLAPIFVHGLQNLMAGLVAVLAAISLANTPALGVLIQPEEGGCRVRAIVPGGGAEEAGLRAGDLITVVDGYAVRNLPELQWVLRQRRVGDRVWVVFVQDGEFSRVEVVLKPRSK
jgi:membrane protease YdiL (CAAX protease family)